MQFQWSGQRDPRRRRVLNDTVLGEAEVADLAGIWSRTTRGADGRPQRRSPNYGDAEFMEEQPRLTDLVPRRLSVLAVLFVLGLGMVAGLEALYAWMPRMAHLTTDGRIAAFDLDGEGSLAVWFSSFTLQLAAGVAVLVFLVRRHKTDDYQGYYRVWLWAAFCWMLLSVDETASLHEGFKEMMAYLTGARLFGDGSIWWVMAYGFLLGSVGTRLLVDMRHCLASTSALGMVGACYTVAVVTQLGWILPEAGARGVMLEEGAEMVGNLFLLLSMTLHARYVVLDAEGLLPARRVSRSELLAERQALLAAAGDDYEEEDDAETEPLMSSSGSGVRVHPPHGTPRPAASKSSKSTAPAFDPAKAEANVGRKLTKQEKKALRRRLEKQRRERERKAG